MGKFDFVERSSLNEQQKVGKLVEKHYDSSLLNAGLKGKRRFEGLTKLEKRQWREALQRAIAACKTRQVARALAGVKLRGRTKWKQSYQSRREVYLMEFLGDDRVELQMGAGSRVATAAAVVGGALAARTMISASDACAKISATADTIQDAVGDGKNVFQTVSEKFTEMLDQLKRLGGWVFKIAAAVSAYWLVSRFSESPMLVNIFIAAVATYVPEVVSYVKSAMGVEQQSGGIGLAGLLTLICTVMVPMGKTPRFVGDFMRTVAFLPKVTDGMEVFLEKTMRVVESFVNFILRRDSTTWITVGRKKTLVELWRRECVDICSKFDAQPKPDRDLVKLASKKVQEGYGFLAMFTSNEAKKEVSMWVDKLNSRLAPHLATLTAEHNVRPMPYMAMLGGESGIGKTSVVQAFASFVLLLAGEVKASEVLPNLWQKGISEYWNGYLGQRAIIKDDCFQVKGIPGQQDSEAMEVIRAVGNWACPLNFADVESKGRYYLDVALIVGTTNAKNIRADWEPYIANPDALVRRFQGAYWLEINDDWSPDKKFDFYRVDELYKSNLKQFAERKEANPEWKPTVDDVLDLFPWHVWTVRRHTYDHSSPLNGSIVKGGLKEAVKLAAVEIKRRRESHGSSVQALTSHLQIVQDVLDDVELQAGGLPRSSGSLASFEIDVVSIGSAIHEPWDSTSTGGLESPPSSPSQHVPLGEISCVEDEEEENWLRSCVKNVRNGLDSLYDMLGIKMDALRVALDVTVLAAAVGVLVGIIKSFWSILKTVLGFFGIKPKVQHQSNDTPPREKKTVKTFDFPVVDLQLGTPPQEGVHEAIWRNMYTIELENREDKSKSIYLGTMLGIGDSVYLLPKHFVTRIKKEKDSGNSKMAVRITLAHQTSFSVLLDLDTFTKNKVACLDGFDMLAMRFGKVAGLRANRNIVKYFLASHELANILRGSNVPVRLDVVRQSNGVFTRNVMHASGMSYVGTVKSVEGDQMRGCVEYEMPTMAGDCGGPLTLEENRHYGGRAIVGLHVAGKSGYFARKGYTTLMPRETVKEMWLLLTEFKDVSDNVTEDILWEGPAEFVETQAGLVKEGLVGGSITYLGQVSRPINVATKSAYNKSPMQEDELFGPTPSAPAPLYPVWRGDQKVNPMVKAVEAYQSEVLIGDPDDLDVAASMAFKPLFEVTKSYPRCILTFDEALVPPVGWKLKPINRRTSAGYKYKDVIQDLAKFPGKTWFLGHEGDIDLNNPNLAILRRDVDNLLAHARKGERTLHIFTDFLKDELRPLEKVEAVKTRMISGAELDYVIAVRMYFGAFQAAMFATRIRNGMSPGVNHYTEWAELAERLVAKGGKVFDGDFSRFDASEQPWVHEAILRTINKWYAQSPDWCEEDDIVRGVLWEDLIHSRHLTGLGNQLRYVVQWHKSLPSGHPLTTVVNSMYSLLTLTSCYMKLTGDACDMWDHVFINTFGDDNVTGVDDTVADEFNQITVGPVMSSIFGLTYTPGVKDGVPVAYTDIGCLTYLQRSFLVDDDKESLLTNCPNVGWVAPLNPKSFLFPAYWYKNTRDPKFDIAENCKNLVCELALHPRELWNKYFPPLEAWCRNNDVPLRFVNREAARSFIKSRLDVWF